MLIKFEVKNFAGFKDNFVFDLTSSKKYDYNNEMINKKVVQKSLIYGPNGSGKSSLCSALMDITYNLVDKQKVLIPNDKYFYAGNINNLATFCYYFKFDKSFVKYEYTKSSCLELIYEKLYINDELYLEYNFTDYSHYINKFSECNTLNMKGLPQQISAIKYIYNNTIQNEKSIICQLVNYVGRMLFFKRLSEGNNYIGYSLGSNSLSSIVLNNRRLDDFKKFLCEQGLEYNLVEYTDNGVKNIGIKFETGKIVAFESIASSGTKTLWLLYCWMLEFNNVSMLIIDEFDAYYHYSTAQAILKLINSYSRMQTVITTHNMMLMNNDITRPDCCFILDNNEIKPLCKLTNKEIRRKNNLQKMYIDGEFSNCLL